MTRKSLYQLKQTQYEKRMRTWAEYRKTKEINKPKHKIKNNEGWFKSIWNHIIRKCSNQKGLYTK